MANNSYAPTQNFQPMNFLSPDFYSPTSSTFLDPGTTSSGSGDTQFQAGYNYQLGNGTGYDSPNVYGAIQQSNNTDYANSNAGLLAGALGSTVEGSALGGSLGGSLGTAGAIAGGVGAVVGAYEGASTNTGASVLSGAASGAITGAEIGSIVPGIGTVIGGVAGAVIGGIAGFFGSKSKKEQEKKAFTQQLQLATAPARQAEANYLQNQGLLQSAMSNYKSAYQPNGANWTNPMLAGTKSNLGQVDQSKVSPLNFNVAPTDITSGKGPQPLAAAAASTTPNAATSQNTPNGLVAPKYTGNKTQDNANLQAYQQAYAQQLQQGNQAQAMSALNNYSQFAGGQGYS